jgi:hypothetical protein
MVPIVTDLSAGERALLTVGSFVEGARSRPAVLMATLAAVGAIAAMAASLSGASSLSFGGFRSWILFAAAGFGLPTQLGLLVATLVLVIDGRSAEVYPAQRALFGGVVLMGVAGVAVNLMAMVSLLTVANAQQVGAGTLAEAWTIIIAGYLAPAILAGFACWVGLIGPRWSRTHGGDRE